MKEYKYFMLTDLYIFASEKVQFEGKFYSMNDFLNVIEKEMDNLEIDDKAEYPFYLIISTVGRLTKEAKEIVNKRETKIATSNKKIKEKINKIREVKKDSTIPKKQKEKKIAKLNEQIRNWGNRIDEAKKAGGLSHLANQGQKIDYFICDGFDYSNHPINLNINDLLKPYEIQEI